MGLLRVLQPDLRSLSFEAKKKFPEVKEAAERAVLKLRVLEEQCVGDETTVEYQEAVAKSEEVLKPFILACNSKHPKLVSVAIAAFQKLISYRCVSMQLGIPKIVSAFYQHSDSSDEAVLLKILQSMVTIMTADFGLHGSALARSMEVCFRLLACKNPVVQNTASATLRQVAILLFDKAWEEKCAQKANKSNPQEEKNNGNSEKSIRSENLENDEDGASKQEKQIVISKDSPYSDDAYNLLLDMCLLASGDSPSILRIKSLSPSFCLEIIESVLSGHPELYYGEGRFNSLLKDRVCPLVHKSFKLGTGYGLVIRILRVMCIIVQYFTAELPAECEVALLRLIRLLRVAENPLWIHTAVLEVFQTFCSQSKILKAIATQYDLKRTAHEDSKEESDGHNASDAPSSPRKDSGTRIFQNVVHCTAHFVQKMFDWHQVVPSPVRSRCIDMLNQNEPPQVPSSYVVSITAESLIGVANCMFELASGSQDKGDGQKIDVKAVAEQDIQLASLMANSCWPSLLGALSVLLSKSNDRGLLTGVLRATKACIHTCSLLQIETPRDAFLTALCKGCLPKPNTNPSNPAGSQNIRDQDTVTRTDSADKTANPDGTSSTLTMKTILCIKTLFSVAHSAGEVLGTGWLLVLDTFNNLEKILRNPQLHGPVSQEDINSISAQLDALLQTSDRLSDSALLSLVKGLIELSNRDLSSNSSAPPQLNGKTFGLTQLLEACLRNIHRCEVVWDVVAEHLLVVADHRLAETRSIGVDILTQVISASFEDYAKNVAKQMEHHPNGEGKEQSEFVVNFPLQNRFMEVFEGLCRSNYSDTRAKTLESLHNVLQSSGQVLTTCWPLVLSILMTIAVNNDKSHLYESFRSVKLVCSDFLSHLPVDCLALLITSIGCYGLQTSDINISLTAVELLWTISEFLDKDYIKLKQEDGSFCDKEGIGKLWISLFREMKQLCLEQRPEVRNCAIRTLYKTVSMHGPSALTLTTWSQVIWEIILPMLDEVRTTAAAAANDNVEVALGKKRDGQTVKLLVHHSRNNAHKQWNETLVLTFTGFVRVVKILFITLFQVLGDEGLNKLWTDLLVIADQYAATSIEEVSVNTIQGIQEILPSVAKMECFTNVMWKNTIKSLSTIGHLFALEEQTQPTLHAMADALFDIYNGLREKFDADDVKVILGVLGPLSTVPGKDSHALSSVQSTILTVFKSLPPVQDDIFCHIFVELLSIIAKASGYQYNLLRKSTINDIVKFSPSSLNGTSSPQHFTLASKTIEVILDLYENSASKLIRAKVFCDIIRVVGSCTVIKFQHYDSNVWRDSATALCKIIKLGLPCLEESNIFANSKEGENERVLTWTALADVFEYFLFHDSSNLPMLSPEQIAQDEELDVQLVDCLGNDVITHSRFAVLMHQRLIEILRSGAQATQERERFGGACFTNLVQQVSRAAQPDNPQSDNMKIAELALPELMKHSREVLDQFVERINAAGKLPLARNRLNEILLVLKELKQLKIETGLPALTKNSQKSPRRHLLLLFPVLCDCITTREQAVKDLLKEIFHICAVDLGLE